MKRIAAIAAAVLMLTGCANDPLGIAKATQIDANAQVAIEQIRADAAMSNATRDYALATQSQALLREARSDAVIVLLALALVVVVAVVVTYILMRERAPVKVQPVYIAPPARRSLPPPMTDELFIDALLLEDKTPRY